MRRPALGIVVTEHADDGIGQLLKGDQAFTAGKERGGAFATQVGNAQVGEGWCGVDWLPESLLVWLMYYIIQLLLLQ